MTAAIPYIESDEEFHRGLLRVQNLLARYMLSGDIRRQIGKAAELIREDDDNGRPQAQAV